MLFNSIEFLLFFPAVVFLYFLIPQRRRWILLLIASYFFYMSWKAEYAILIMLSTFLDYFCGRMMGRQSERRKRTPFLVMSLMGNLGLLFSFKYFNFFNNSLRALFEDFHIVYPIPVLNVLLPVGISFYTFQTLSYTIDVYLGKQEPEHHLGIFALYVSFFPQLVAGPIERSTNLLPQFYKTHDFNYRRITDGLKLMAWGFFKKVVIADRLAVYVNEVYNHPHDYTGWPILMATYFFAFQIFCDFSGYSDIAIGSAQVMGYSLMKNFNRPYFSKSISEFWKRWHISLSSWFRDYLYIPLGGNRVVKWRWYYNLFIVFLISGLWHGANWTFVVWGALHGFYLLFSIWTKSLRMRVAEFFKMDRHPSFYKFIQIGITFHLVLFSWIFFRANSISDAFLLLKNIFIFRGFHIVLYPIITREYMLIALLSIGVMELVHTLQRRFNLLSVISSRPLTIRWTFYFGIVFIILFFGQLNSNQFIYFQF